MKTQREKQFIRLARRIVWYFGPGDIDRLLDGDVAVRDMAMECLDQEKPGHGPISGKTWKALFPKGKKPE